jgi:hypothetical protein
VGFLCDNSSNVTTVFLESHGLTQGLTYPQQRSGGEYSKTEAVTGATQLERLSANI